MYNHSVLQGEDRSQLLVVRGTKQVAAVVAVAAVAIGTLRCVLTIPGTVMSSLNALSHSIFKTPFGVNTIAPSF